MQYNAQPFILYVLEGGGLRVYFIKRKGLFDTIILNYKSQNLAEARNLAVNMSILEFYPHLSLGGWVSPVVHALHNLDSVVGGGA